MNWVLKGLYLLISLIFTAIQILGGSLSVADGTAPYGDRERQGASGLPNHMAMLIRTASHTEKILMEMQIHITGESMATAGAHMVMDWIRTAVPMVSA